MIRWTRAGAVEEPGVLQVRVAAGLPGRVAAGAPEPSRPLTASEIEANIRHYTIDRRGPRSKPCAALVLSGIPSDPQPLGAPTVGELARILGQVRELGIERVVLHLAGDAADAPARALASLADVCVVRLETPADAVLLEGLAAERNAIVVLTADALPRLDAIVDALIPAPGRGRAAPARVVFTWPFSGSDVPPAMEAAAAARGPLQRLGAAGIAAGVKGIPLCTLAPGPSALESWEGRVWRSTNRFYVDADHQRDDAMMFFPDLVRFTKADSCRFCAAVTRCDGVVETWLRRGLAGPLVPLG